MYWSGLFIMYLNIAIIMMVMLRRIETISDKTWLNHIEDLSAKVEDYNVDSKTIESHPLNEGFLLFSNNHKKSSSIAPTSADSPGPTRNSTLNDTLTTTCKTTTVVDVRNETSSQLNESNDDEINTFLKVDDEEFGKQLVNMEVTVDGSGDTTSETISTELSSSISTTSTSTLIITNSTTTPTNIILSGYSTFLITVDCINASAILMNILNQFRQTFPYSYDVTYDNTTLICPRSVNIDVLFTFFTDNNISILTNLFQTLGNIASGMGIELKSVNRCGTGQTVSFNNVTSCYLINLCGLCGTNPPRGVCLPEKNISKCECFVNENHPSAFYIDDFCTIPNENGVTSISTSWAPIVIGILAGIAGLFCVTTSYLLIMFVYRRRSGKDNNSDQSDMQASEIWYIPRVRVPTSATAANIPNYLGHSMSISRSNRSSTPDSIFFEELDQKIGRNPRAMLTNLPSDIPSIRSSHDPINELDAIIDNEDVDVRFHELLGQDNEIFEMMNPNLQLQRLNIST